MIRILITGSAGFVGSHFVKYFLDNTDYEVIALVRMNRAGNLERLADLQSTRLKVIYHDLRSPMDVIHNQIGKLDYIVNIASDSHVDYSITNPVDVIVNNTMCATTVLEYARKYQPELIKFLYYSTDEVFGCAFNREKPFTEFDLLTPHNPYSASKAGGEMITQSYYHTFEIPIVITRTMNMYGEWQDKEKMIPKCIEHIVMGKTMPIHEFNGVLGKRYWLYAGHSALMCHQILLHGKVGEIFNCGSENEFDNLQVAQMVAKIIGVPLKYEIVEANNVRRGYDRKYWLDDSKVRLLQFAEYNKAFYDDFENNFKKTVLWYTDNLSWLGI